MMRCGLIRYLNKASSGVCDERDPVGATSNFEGTVQHDGVLKLSVQRELTRSYEVERFYCYKSSIAIRGVLCCNLDVANARKEHSSINKVISDCATHSNDQ